MAILRKTAAQKVAELEEKQTELAGLVERAEADLEQATRALAGLAGAEAEAFLGGGDAGRVAKDRETARAGVAAARAELARLRAIGPEFERRLGEARQEVHAEQVAAAEAALAKANSELVRASEVFAAALPLGQLGRLEQARARVEECAAAVRELGGEVELVDEAAYPAEVAGLVVVLGEGPRQPVATSARRSEEFRRASERQTAEAVARAVSAIAEMPNDAEYVEGVLFRVPADRRDEVLERVAALRAEARARREAEREAFQRS